MRLRLLATPTNLPTVYERAGYDYSLDYTRPLEPPLRPEDADWVTEKVKAFLAAQRQGR